MKTIKKMKNHAKKTLQIAALSATMLFSVNGFAGPIHDAAISGNTAEVLRLIQAGADVNAQSNDGWTPLHFAAWKGKTETTIALIKAGADVNVQNKWGKTPLDYAKKKGHTETAYAIENSREILHKQADAQAAEIAEILLNAQIAYKVGNYEAALPLIKQLAKEGDIWGMTQLGEMFETGKVVAVNAKLAKQWYKKAGDKGSVFAKERYYSMP